MDCIVRGVAKSWTRLSDFHFHFMRVKEIMAFALITSWQIKGGKWKQWQILFSWDLKSLQTVTAAMKLKDACSLEEKL